MIKVILCTLIVMLTASAPVHAQTAVEQGQAPSAQASAINKPVQQGSLSAFFHKMYMKVTGKQDTDPDPTATLVAPFADSTATPAKAGERNIMRLSTNTAPLDQPHRSSADLAEWLSQAMSETLSFNAENYKANLKTLSKGMNADALAQYDSWVNTSGILAVLQTNGMQLNGSVEEKPFLVNEGPVSGRYRWLYEVPVLISFVPRGATALDKESTADDRKLLLTIQIGRVAESQLPDHVMIESWAVKDNTRKN
ncbi:MAG: hypothetical protein JWO78_117 [Micavibrio sp.]|nr:hypothetical protein [Micavibrio sp.]